MQKEKRPKDRNLLNIHFQEKERELPKDIEKQQSEVQEQNEERELSQKPMVRELKVDSTYREVKGTDYYQKVAGMS